MYNMTVKSIMIDMDEPRAGAIAEVLTNETCRKLLDVLADREMSESEMAEKLHIPLNTVGYNIKKLSEAGLIEVTRNVLWSVKGKRVKRYAVVNKRIIISPRRRFRGVIPAVLLSGIAALGIRAYLIAQNPRDIYSAAPVIVEKGFGTGGQVASASLAADSANASASAAEVVPSASELYSALVQTGNQWIWFLAGALACMIIFLAWNWRKL